MSKLSTYYGHSDYENAVRMSMHWRQLRTGMGWSTSFRLGEFLTEEEAEMACEDENE